MSENILTKEQRHEVYIQALEYLNKFIKINCMKRMCGALDEAFLYLYEDIYNKNIGFGYIYQRYTFIEIYEQEHLRKKTNSAYWFNSKDNEPRIRILERAIELTK